MNKNSWLDNRLGVLATMHQKEQVIAPIFEVELGMKIIVPPNFDTDCFGTFTRDIKRIGTQLEAARFKAEKALEVTGESIAIASEGTFSPHPAFPYISCNRELVLLIDKINKFEIVGYELSTETNYEQKLVKSVEEALNFAQKVGFPSHALVVMFRKDTQQQEEIFKGITTTEELIESVQFTLKKSGDRTAHIETDMRAMYNPTRMKVIEKATLNLIQKINQLCPNCSCPGFDVVEQQKGLPCEACNLPTPSIRAEIYQCQKCNFRQEKLFPNGIEFAEPTYCLYCNP